ncbi:MAG: ArnT family glycosyltransferase [Phycisphaerae bacterium]
MTDRGAVAGDQRSSRVIIEIVLVCLFALGWFFWGLQDGDLIRTEGLRAIVVKEMVPKQNEWIPTVHQRTYLRKLPLYAWTTTAIARSAGGLSEFVARLPSACLAVGFALLMYGAGRWLIDERAGLPAAFLAIGNWEVLDYGMRAELDMGVLFFTTASVLAMGRAWQSKGSPRGFWIPVAYALAVIGTFWKAPHVLLTLWMTVAGLTIIQRRERNERWWSFALHPAQIISSVAALACLGIAGSSRMGNFVLFELLARVVPHSLSYVTGLLEAPFHLIGAGGIATIFAAFLLDKSVRANWPENQRASLKFLLAWTIPTTLFLFAVPAKAARYDFIVAGGVILLGASIWRMYADRKLPAVADKRFDAFIKLLAQLTAISGGAMLAIAPVMIFGSHWITIVPGQMGWLIAVAGACTLALGLRATIGLRHGKREVVGLTFVLLLVVMKPLQVMLYIPARSKAESKRPIASAIDEQVPVGQTVYVLSDKPRSDRAGEMADIGVYCSREIRWPRDIDEAQQLAKTNAEQEMWLLLREKAHERVDEKFGDQLQNRARFERENDILFLNLLRWEAQTGDPATAD